MRTRTCLLLFIMGGLIGSLSPATAKAPKDPPTIPKAFWGRWDYDGKLCKGDFDSWITISATSIDSGEDSSEVIAVKRLSATSIRVTTKDDGELTGDSPPGSDAYIGRSTNIYSLSDKGHTLKSVSAKTHDGFTAEKCAEDTPPAQITLTHTPLNG